MWKNGSNIILTNNFDGRNRATSFERSFPTQDMPKSHILSPNRGLVSLFLNPAKN